MSAPRHISLLVGLSLLVSCTEIFEVELDNADPVIVIEGTLTNLAETHTVMISMTAPWFSSGQPEAVSGAQVFVTAYSLTIPYTEVSPGLYSSPGGTLGLPGLTYTLHVVHEGQEYTATSEMRPVTRIDSITLYKNDDRWKNLSIGVYGKEPGGSEDHYLFTSLVNHELESDTINEIILANDNLINGNNFGGVLVQYVHAEPEDTVSLRMANISREYYEYLLAILKETRFAGSPLESAPAPIRGNFSGGALGYFSAHAVSVRTKIFNNPEK